LFFNRADFYSAYAGKFLKESNIIHGKWTDDGHKKHPVTFVPVNPDTVTGLHPRNLTLYTWKKPSIRKDGLTTCSLSDQNIRQGYLDSLTAKVMHEQYPNMHSILISRNGCLFYEEYFYGWKADDLWLIQSATKSFTSTLTGITLAKGELKSLDETICSYLPEYKLKACSEQNKGITIRQLLTMSTGLDWNELEHNYYDDRNTLVECGKAKDPFDCLLSRNKTANSDAVFSYNSMNHSMMNKILRRTTGLRNEKELNQRLLSPLQIERFKTGEENFGVIGDISLTPRDMHKFGILFLNNGRWNGKQIVPSHWVKEATSTKIDIGPDEGYGYFWWTKKFMVGGKTIESYYAWGYGGQYIFIVPSKQLVVTITGSNWIMDEKKFAFEMMEKFIIPACGD
jgi:hypothetical protein